VGICSVTLREVEQAAAPTRDVGQFVTTITAVVRGLDVYHPERFGVLPDFKVGAGLDFFQLK
jgi:hypothetical protein